MKRLAVLLILVLNFPSFSQVGPYTWQDHLGLTSCNTLAHFNNKIYASNYNGIVIIDEEEGSTTRLNKINGLSDVSIRLLRVNETTHKLMVIYENSNIDVIDENNLIKNFPDIKLKSISGKKTINEVFFSGKFAYLATGLGILLFDTEKMEIKDTYIIGPGGTDLEVNQVTLNDSLIFAATANGIYYSNHKKKILNNFASWKLAPVIPPGYYCGVAAVQNTIVAVYNPSKFDPANSIDTLYTLANNVWTRYTATPNIFKKMMHVDGTRFAVMAQFGPLILNLATNISEAYYTTCNGKDYVPQDIIFYTDKTDRVSYWIGDYIFGVMQTYASYPYGAQFVKTMNGVRKRLVGNIDVFKGETALSPSHPDNGGGSNYFTEGINHFRDNQWEYFDSKDAFGETIYDINHVYFDRNDKSKMWVSTWGNGLCEYKDHQIVNTYNLTNSALSPVFGVNIRVGGVSMDNDGNLWIANSDVKNYIVVKRANGSWGSYNCEVPLFTRKIFADKNNNIWALHERDGGITVLNHHGFTNGQYKVLSKDAGNGNLGSNAIYGIEEDKDGKIWVGTGAGIRVFYSPATIFNNSGFDAEPIKIVQDGNVELLLEKEVCTCIKVDGANNKWVGTETGGLYCFNPDGQKQLYHFTKETSPLYSNNIVDLNYNDVTGDIFIGTDIGLQSFRSAIIEGSENCNSLYAYPNPVKPNYSGNVFIRGMLDASIVKITDESGNLVWETKSQGGQVEWNKKNLSGALAASGVYVAYAMTTNGEVRCLTKILLVN
jgi:hypothetical protein